MTDIPLMAISSNDVFNVYFSVVFYFGAFSFFIACLCKIIDRS